MQNNIEAVLAVMQHIYDNIMYAELNTKSDYCQKCGFDGEIKIVEDDGKLVWECPNCGYKLQLSSGKVLYATDTNNLNGISAPNFDLYLLEANYEDEEIQARISEKKANGEFVYERRVLGTHLSKAKCDDFIYQNIGPAGEYVYLHGHVEEEKA